jgi:hypothetical protein
MARYDADKDKRLHDPLEFVLGGKEYQVVEVTDEIMGKINTLLEGFGTEGGDMTMGRVQNEQLAILTGQPAETFADATLRAKAGVLQWITATLADPIGAGSQRHARS